MKTNSDMKRKKISNFIIIAFFILYTIITLIPFYFLAIRSFVPGNMSTEMHLLIPKANDFNLDSQYGNVSTYYNLNTTKFKEYFGIKGYIKPSATFREIAVNNNISEEKMIKYMNPFVKFNGWYVIVTDNRFLHSIAATSLLTVLSLIVGGFLSLCTGSVLAGLKKKWHSLVYSMYMLQIIIPSTMIILPVYMILAKILKLQNTYWPLFLINIKGGALVTMIFTAYISKIPKELKESVDIDGGSRITYFFRILVPLAKVPLGSYMVIMLPVYWNELINGMLFLNEEKYTLIPMISSLQGTFTTNFQAIYAGLCISIIPMLIVYLVFQKLFVRSALSGAIKG